MCRRGHVSGRVCALPRRPNVPIVEIQADGPDFKLPGSPPVSGYLPTGQLQSSLASGGARTQRVARGRDVPGEWWALFGSAQLDRLIRRGIEYNADVKAQEAAIRAAHANWQAQRGALFPTLSANYDFTRQKVATESQSSNAASGASIYSVHTAQLSAGFVPDVFGGTRRMIEAAGAQVSIEELRREAIVLTMTAGIALAAIQEASLRGQIFATRRLIDIQTQNPVLAKIFLPRVANTVESDIGNSVRIT